MSEKPDTGPTERYERLHEARELAIKACMNAQQKQKQQYDKTQYMQEFNVGDLVLILQPRGYTGQTTKLRHPYRGPYEILAKYSDLVYLVKRKDQGRNQQEELVHIARMKPYFSRETREITARESASSTSMIQRIYIWLMTILLCTHWIEGRVIWRTLDIPITKGIQDVVFLVKYVTPCDSNHQIFKSEPFSFRANITRKFENWCYDYTHTVINEKLKKFCDDDGTAPMMLMRSEKAHRKKKARHQHIDHHRDKRWGTGIVESVALVVGAGAVVYWAGSKVYDYFMGTPTTSNVEEVAYNNLQNSMKLATESREINRRLDGVYEMMNSSMNIMEDFKQQLKALRMEASIENQAIISTAVTMAHLIGHDLEEVSAAWHEHRLSDKFPKLFGYKDPCIDSTCPLIHHRPSSCRYDAEKQQIRFTLQRRIVDPDLQVVRADPFAYYRITSSNQISNESVWMNKQTKIQTCKSVYQGPRTYAVDKMGCMKTIKPEDATINDFPLVLDGCVTDPYQMSASHELYGDWNCANLTPMQFDSQSVQIKKDNDKVLIYCAYQQIKVGTKSRQDCPTTEVVELPSRSNFTIYRHVLRNESETIMTYHHQNMAYNTTTKFEIPEMFRQIAPHEVNGKHALDELVSIKRQLKEALATNRVRQEGLKYQFSKFMKENKTTWWKRMLYGGGAIALIILLLFIASHVYVSCTPGIGSDTDKSEGAPSAPAPERLKKEREKEEESEYKDAKSKIEEQSDLQHYLESDQPREGSERYSREKLRLKIK